MERYDKNLAKSLVVSTKRIENKVSSKLPSLLSDVRAKKISTFKDFYQNLDPKAKLNPLEKLLLAAYCKLYYVIFKQNPLTNSKIKNHLVLITALLTSKTVVAEILNYLSPFIPSDKSKALKRAALALAKNTITALVVSMVVSVFIYFKIIQSLTRKQFISMFLALTVLSMLTVKATLSSLSKTFVGITSTDLKGMLIFASTIIASAAVKPLLDKLLTSLRSGRLTAARKIFLVFLVVLIYLETYEKFKALHDKLKQEKESKELVKKYEKMILDKLPDWERKLLQFHLYLQLNIKEAPKEVRKYIEKKYGPLTNRETPTTHGKYKYDINYNKALHNVLDRLKKQYPNVRPAAWLGSNFADFHNMLYTIARYKAEKIVDDVMKKYEEGKLR